MNCTYQLNSAYKINIYLLFFSLITLVNGNSQAIDEDVIIYAQDKFNTLDIDSLQVLLNGSWISSDHELTNIVIEDSIWTIKFKTTEHKYKAQYNRTIDNRNISNINITLFIEGKKWDGFKGTVNETELLLFILGSISNTNLKFKEVFGKEYYFIRE